MQGECGLYVMVEHGKDRPLFEIPTTQCAHCDKHFVLPRFLPVFVKGMVSLIGYGFGPEAKESRIGRGWCSNHGPNGWVCSDECGATCIDRTAKREILEGTRNPTTISVAVPQSKLWLPPIYER